MAHPLPTAAARSRSTATSTRPPTSLDARPRRRRRRAGASFAGPYLEHFDALRATMLAGFPPVRRAVAARSPRSARRARCDFAAARCRRRRARSASGCSRRRRRARWLYGVGDARRRAARRRRQRDRGVYLNLLGHAVGWPSPEGGAGRLTDALVGRLRADRRRGPDRRARRARHLRARGRVTGVDGRRRRARRGATSWSPTSCRARSPRMAGDALPAAYRRAPAPLPLRRRRRSRSTGRSTARSRGRRRSSGRRHGPRRRRRGRAHAPRCAQSTARPARAAVPAPRPAVRRRPDTRAGRQAHRVGLHARPAAGRRLGRRARPPRRPRRGQVERFAPGFRDRILARHVMGPADLEHRNRNLVGRRRRRRQLPPRPGRLPPRAVAVALPHAAGRPLPRQRRRVPRRRRPRRPRRRGRARRARRPGSRAAVAPRRPAPHAPAVSIQEGPDPRRLACVGCTVAASSGHIWDIFRNRSGIRSL